MAIKKEKKTSKKAMEVKEAPVTKKAAAKAKEVPVEETRQQHTAPPPPPQQDYYAPPQYHTDTNRGRIPYFSEISNQTFLRTRRIRAEGMKYIEQFQETIKGFEGVIDIKAILVATPEVDALVVYNPRSFVSTIIFFHESFNSSTKKLPTDCAQEVMAQFSKMIRVEDKGVDYGTVNSVTIVPEEYDQDKATLMAHSIANMLIGYTSVEEGKFNIDTFTGKDSSKGYTFCITTNMMEVHDYVNANSPHSVPDRADIGFLVRLDGPPHAKFRGDVLFAVTGYTKFIPTSEFGSGNNKILPVPTISSIVSRTPISGMVPIAITAAAEVFCKNLMWLEPYRSLSPDKPNLGYMLNTNFEGMKPNDPILTAEHLNAAVGSMFENPLLALDVSEGRFNIPTVTSMAYCLGPIFRVMCRFFNETHLVDGLDVDELEDIALSTMQAQRRYRTLTGLTYKDGDLCDSRQIDFMFLAPYYDKVNLPTLEGLRAETMEPEFRITQIRNFYEKTRSVYNTMTTIFADAGLAYLYDRLRKNNVNFECDYRADAITNQVYANDFRAINWQADRLTLGGYSYAQPYAGFGGGSTLYR